jgi:acetyl esterase/lipase
MFDSPDPLALTRRHPHVRIETHPTSRRLRALNAIARHTVRKFFDLVLRLEARGLVAPSRIVSVAGLIDPVLVVVRPPRGTRLRRLRLGGFESEWIWHRSMPDPQQVTDTAILYLHGGGLVLGGLNSHRRLLGRLSRAAGVPVLNVAYRQNPHAHVTETVEDCLVAYRYLLGSGLRPERIVVAGDSAGGGLTFALALAALRAGLPAPGGIVAISPWVDYDSTSRLAHPNAHTDVLFPAGATALLTKFGLAKDGVLDPVWSPINHQFDGLPPVLIHVGSTEVLRSDSERLVQRCADAGVPVTLQIWDDAIHVFHIAADLLPGARDAIDDIALFIRDRVSNAGGGTQVDRTSA